MKLSSEKIIKFVESTKVMNVLKKRDYIHSHLHQVDESLIDELYRKIHSRLTEDPVVGYNASGAVIRKSQFIADIKEAEAQIERGEYLTIEELEKEAREW